MQAIKANSSRWVKTIHLKALLQTGYGAFSISRSSVPIVFNRLQYG
ncbi:MAG: hypothetical protein JNN15_17345 [Blastocatellia bacterium]|nr:hypothetical protein [Blastocatellia bacterium]